MRTLAPPPASVVNPLTRAPRTGSFCGGLPPVDLTPLAPRLLDRILRQKRWIYLAIASDDALVALALVRLGYAANAFAFVYGRAEGRMLAARKALGLPLGVRVTDVPGELSAAGKMPGARIEISSAGAGPSLRVEAELGDLRISSHVDATGAPPAIAAVAALSGGAVVATEKRALLVARGEAWAAGRRVALDGALAGYDYSNGLLPRRTSWRWGFALGRARTGERVGLNLVEGMAGADECALWIDGEIHPLAEGRFSFDRAKPLDPWRVRTEDGAVDLRFTPGGAHEDRTQLGLVRASFLQPAGTYAGTIRAPDGRVLELDGVLGVTEDQDVVW